MSSVISTETRYTSKTSESAKTELPNKTNKHSRIRSAYSQKHREKVEKEKEKEKEKEDFLNELTEKYSDEYERHKKLMKDNLLRAK